jgi:endonuclease/exonuclease/phosphatase family metal-dependent hydrolase
MTFNVRYDEPADGPNAWPHRRRLVIDTIRDHGPDLLALQEATAAQFDEIAAALTDYTAFGTLRDEWGGVEHYGGFIRTARFDVLGEGLFWLSDTPSVPHSLFPENDWGPRACAWIRLRDRSHDRALVFAATHVDTHAGCWTPSAKVLDAELTRIAGDAAVVLTGDFNCPAGSDAHGFLLRDARFRDAWSEAGGGDEGVVTFHGFTGAACLPDGGDSALFPADALALGNYRIDWILIRGPLAATHTRIDHRREGRVHPSDHYPVVADVRWSSP